MTDDLRTEGAASGASASNKYRKWHGLLNCGFTGQSCRLRVRGEYHLGMRTGGARLEKRRTDFNPTIFTIDVVQADGDGGDWIELNGEFDAGPEVERVVLIDWHDEKYEFPVERRDT